MTEPDRLSAESEEIFIDILLLMSDRHHDPTARDALFARWHELNGPITDPQPIAYGLCCPHCDTVLQRIWISFSKQEDAHRQNIDTYYMLDHIRQECPKAEACKCFTKIMFGKMPVNAKRCLRCSEANGNCNCTAGIELGPCALLEPTDLPTP